MNTNNKPKSFGGKKEGGEKIVLQESSNRNISPLPSCSFTKYKNEEYLPRIAKNNSISVVETNQIMGFLDNLLEQKHEKNRKINSSLNEKSKLITEIHIIHSTTKQFDETLKEKREKHHFLKFLKFLGYEHQKKKGKTQTLDGDVAESSVPGVNLDHLNSAIIDNEQESTWKQLKTVNYQRGIDYFGTKTNVSWQIEKDIKYQAQMVKKVDNSNKVCFIPQEELIEKDTTNQVLLKFIQEVEEKNMQYTQCIDKLAEHKEKKERLLNQRLLKNQKPNWILDIDPWLEEEEPWKTMEAEEKCFSLKLVPESNLIEKEETKSFKINTKLSEAEIVNKSGRKKLMMQAYLTTQEENLFQDLKEEAERSYHMLTRNVLLSGKVRDQKCCKIYKKNHKCKRGPKAQKSRNISHKKLKDTTKTVEVVSNPSMDIFTKLYNDRKSKIIHISNHPLFCNKAVLNKRFTTRECTQFSKYHKDAIKDLKKIHPENQHYYESERFNISKPCPVTIFPIQKASSVNTETFDEKVCNEIHTTVQEEESADEEEEDEFNLRFMSYQSAGFSLQ